eukprot:13923347-Alexandrium_andersonii.AAC.1
MQPVWLYTASWCERIAEQRVPVAGQCVSTGPPKGDGQRNLHGLKGVRVHALQGWFETISFAQPELRK